MKKGISLRFAAEVPTRVRAHVVSEYERLFPYLCRAADALWELNWGDWGPELEGAEAVDCEVSVEMGPVLPGDRANVYWVLLFNLSSGSDEDHIQIRISKYVNEPFDGFEHIGWSEGCLFSDFKSGG